MNIKKLITVGIAAIAAFAAVAEPTVTDVVAKQRCSWNGLVDIAFETVVGNEMACETQPELASPACYDTYEQS